MMIDIDQVRAETPACKTLIHFNNAGASLMPEPVHRAVVDHLELEARRGGYEAAAAAEADIAAFYPEMARLIGAAPDEIAFVENATRAWDLAFYSLPLQAGDRIITHRSEYVSNYLAFLHQAQRRGLHIDLAPSDAAGQIDVAAMEALIGPQTRLIALTHVPTHGGLVNPAEAVGQVAKKHGVTYLLDACQSVGQIVLDVEKIGCDILTGTGRKYLRGPRGTGFLYVSRRIIDQIDPPFIDLRAATLTGIDSYALAPGGRRFENWESYVAGRVGLTAALRYAQTIGIAAIEARVTDLAAQLRQELAAHSSIELHDTGVWKCGIVTFTKAGETAGSVVARLYRKGINVSATGISSALLDFAPRGLDAIVRASVHYYNTQEEISRFCAAVVED